MKGILKMEKSNLDYVDSFLEEIVGVDFIDIDDLFANKKLIRRNYMQLTTDYKRVYKWYYYFKLSMIKDPLKTLMWEYLSGQNVEFDLSKQYFMFCRKRNSLKSLKDKYKTKID